MKKMAQFLSARVEKRGWLRVFGPDALRFLQGMWTCDLRRAVNHVGLPTCGSGLLLTPRGKAVTEGVFLASSSQEFLLSVPESDLSVCLESMNRFLVADEVTLEPVPDQYSSVISVAGDHPLFETINELPKAGEGSLDRIFEVRDQADYVLVPRGRVGSNHFELWIKPHGRLDAKVLGFDLTTSDESWTQLRITHGVPEWHIDWTSESLPLEFPLADAVSFSKGCYTGQEVIARGTYRGQMVKSFARLTAVEELSAGDVYEEGNDLRPVGRLTTTFAKQGLGLVRLLGLSAEGQPLRPWYFKRSDGHKILITQVELLNKKWITT